MNTSGINTSEIYATEATGLEGFDIAAIERLGAYPDGSGGGITQFAWEMKNIREVRGRLDTLENFFRVHQLLLARLSWSASDTRVHPWRKEDNLSVFIPEIRLYPNAYDKRHRIQAGDIVALWPLAEWRRILPYIGNKETTRDYAAEIDGVLLRITDAEHIPVQKVDPFGPLGPIAPTWKKTSNP